MFWSHCGLFSFGRKAWFDPELSGAFNLGPELNGSASVKEVVEWSRAHYGRGVFALEMEPRDLEAGQLTLDISKAKRVLAVKPRWDLRQSIEKTLNWYIAQQQGANAHDLCYADLTEYMG